MRKNLKLINSVNNRHLLNLNVSEKEFREIQTRLRNDITRKLIEFTRRSLYRVFNEGVFDKGGRFYGGWWQGIPRVSDTEEDPTE
jgi:hypothetical protein